MLPPLNETDKSGHNEKEGNQDLKNDEYDQELSNSTAKKHKKHKRSLSKANLSYDQSSNKYLQYKSTSDYTSVVANPKSLRPVPEIFKRKKCTNSFKNSSDSFLLNIVSMSSFNTHVRQRFNHMALISQNFCDWINTTTADELNITSDENGIFEGNKKQTSNKNCMFENKLSVTGNETGILEGKKKKITNENKIFEGKKKKTSNENGMFESNKENSSNENGLFDGNKKNSSTENDMFEDNLNITSNENGLFDGNKKNSSTENDMFEDNLNITSNENGMVEGNKENSNNENGLVESKKRHTSNENDMFESKKKRRKCKNEDPNTEDGFDVNDGESNFNEIKLYRVKENKGLIFHIHHESSFSFCGEIKITVLSGEVEILGYTLNHSTGKNSAHVYSPNFYTELVVETKFPKENKPKVEMESVLRDYLPDSDRKCILTTYDSDDAVLLIEQINSVFGIVVNKYWDKHVFPKDLEDASSDLETVKSVQCAFNLRLSAIGKHFKKNPMWDSVPLGSCTLLCGGKEVGKSTLLRYYINKSLTQGEKVLCLDFDVGQPEFTASGSVSAVVVTEPLLGPNFTHVTSPELMIYFGDIDVVYNPRRYLDCVKYVIDSCKENVEFSGMKWFVNTMGFCKGLGVRLMITIMKLLRPNTVIQIRSPGSNNYPFFMTPANLNSKTGFELMPVDDVKLFHDFYVVESYAVKNGIGKKGKLSQGALKPRQLRDIMSLSYFSKMVSPPYYNFNAVQPYLIPFSQIYLGIHSLLDLNDILKAFNANIVSLLHFEPELEDIYSVDSEDNDYFKIVIKPKLRPCLGLGLVRGIDCKEKKFYVMTHLTPDTLSEVNCFCLERISPPHSMFLKQDTVEGRSVYTTFDSANAIKRVRRAFHGSTNFQTKEKFNF